MNRQRFALATLFLSALSIATTNASAQTFGAVSFVNGLALSGNGLDLSSGSDVERRLGYFSDLYYDRTRGEWWGLSDRGPGGGTLSYETRVQRFTLDVAGNGAISNFKVQQTVKFMRDGAAMNGMAPNPTDKLDNAFDPEGFVINPRNGNLLVSDEYGPSLQEFDRNGNFVRAYTTPANVVPRNAVGTPNFASDSGNTLGKRNNRGFEGLAISPDGAHVYAMLQSPMLEDGGASGNGRFTRIVKFDTTTGVAVGQYAYLMDRRDEGQGISALVALGNDKFLVLERNNRGVGVGARLATGDKSAYQIDLTGATDISGQALPASGDALAPGVVAVVKGAKVIDLDVDTLAALGGKTPEKWEGLAIGPTLEGGKTLVLAGTDNDYSVTQNATGDQLDVWFRMSDADPYASSIQCPIGSLTGCTGLLNDDYVLLPGVLHAYSADLRGDVTPVPEPASAALLLAGLIGTGFAARRRRDR